MWAKDREFWNILEEQMQKEYSGCDMFQLVMFLKNLQNLL